MSGEYQRDSSRMSMSASHWQGHHDASPSIDPGEERQQRVLAEFNGFPFSSDDVFQQGLARILLHQSLDQMSDSERSELVLKTKVFYFNRITGHNINLEDVRDGYTADLNRFRAESGNECSRTTSRSEQGEMHILTFAELKSLIDQGKTDNIPNNKIIPDILNDDVPSKSTAPLRRKPWELATQS